MKQNDVLKIGLDTAEMVCMAYLGDLTDEEFMMRPHDDCHTINWQVGHLIVSEHQMMNQVTGDSMPALPEGMAEFYAEKDESKLDADGYYSKESLLAAYRAQRDATLSALAWYPAEDFNNETGVEYAPTVASMFAMQGGHWMMHAGQWVVVRRMANKPIVI